MDEKEKKCECGKVEFLESVICIPVDEYKRLLRCEVSLGIVIGAASTCKYDSDVSKIVKLVTTMHPDLVSNKPDETQGDDE